MKVNIKTKNFELTEALRDYIQEKMDYLDRLVSEWEKEGGVEMDFEAAKDTMHHNKGKVYYAEANLSVPGKVIRASKNGENLHSAIDEVKEVLAGEIKKYKERVK
ncbi:MAG: ribosome-associated translation inhibitor RaiA [Candidatus Colwellbacteria bacterium]|nr:ribosome-associated translation inhibitor RaiA [Candidatus Colwellbacteria bacterium]